MHDFGAHNYCEELIKVVDKITSLFLFTGKYDKSHLMSKLSISQQLNLVY
jgi:hypothetical protein